MSENRDSPRVRFTDSTTSSDYSYSESSTFRLEVPRTTRPPKGLRAAEVAKKVRDAAVRRKQNFTDFLARRVTRRTGESVKLWLCCYPSSSHLYLEILAGNFGKFLFGGRKYFVFTHRDFINLARKYGDGWTCGDKGIYFLPYEEFKQFFKEDGHDWKELKKAWDKKASLRLRNLKSNATFIPVEGPSTSSR